MSAQQVTRIPAPRIPFANGKGIQLGANPVVDEFDQVIERRKKRALEQGKLQELDLMNEETRNQTLKLKNDNEQLTRTTGAGTNGNRIPVKGDAPRIWQVDEDGMKLRTAKQGEEGLTLEEAKDALRTISRMSDQPIVIFSENVGRHIPNPESDVAKKNPMAAWATAREYDKQLTAGDEPDIIDIYLAMQDKSAKLAQVLGTDRKVDPEMDLLDKFEKIKKLMGSGESESKIVEAINDLKSQMKPASDDNPEMESMRRMITDLSDKLQKAEMDRHKDIEDRLKEEVNLLRGQVLNLQSNQTVGNEYALMSKFIDKLDGGLNGTREMAVSLFKPNGQKGAAETPGQKAAITAQLSQEAQKKKQLITQGRDLFRTGEPQGAR